MKNVRLEDSPIVNLKHQVQKVIEPIELKYGKGITVEFPSTEDAVRAATKILRENLYLPGPDLKRENWT